MNYMKLYIRIIALLLCVAMLFPLCACTTVNNDNKSLLAPSNDGYWGDTETSQENNISWDVDLTPNINITVFDSDKIKNSEIQTEVEDGAIDSIYSLICSSVVKNLENEGFSCGMGVASTIENDNYSALGIYYQSPDYQFFEANSNLESVGFVEVVSADENNYDYNPNKEESIIMVTDVDTISSGEGLDTQKICTYNLDYIGSYHFVYQNKYVTYYQESPMQVVYDIKDNIKENYNLQFGSLYDYDNKRYIYDESIFDEYVNHSAIELFGKEDYAKLEADLKALSEKQYANGYSVSEYNIVYISPESIQAYISSDEEDTFFGYRVDDLTEAFGLGTALTYNGTTFEEAQIIPSDDGYDWKTFLTKCGIGCGIILVGAVLSPMTGGASFSCALFTIVKGAVGTALTNGLGTLAIETVSGLIQGMSIKEALKNATHKGLDAFADGFMIGAAMYSVGVVSGRIKPTACFVAGTPIVIVQEEYKNIEDISVGDTVLSYDEVTKTTSIQQVTEIFESKVYQTIVLKIGNSSIETTPNHPFYSPTYECWLSADSLSCGDIVLDCYGNLQTITEKKYIDSSEGVVVYNFTVDKTHTYYVGECNVLVHNECNSIGAKRQKAVDEAWKREQQAVRDGTSKYNWTLEQKEEILLNGRLSGYDGHHIVPVKEVANTARSSLIEDPENIVFLRIDEHHAVHKFGDTFEKTIDKVIEFRPWVVERLSKLIA